MYALRKDDYDGPIQLRLNDAPPGIAAQPVVIPKGQTVGKLMIRTAPYPMRENFILKVVGSAKIGNREIVHTAVAAEDKMQAFLWRQLVPAKAFVATVFDPNFTPASERPAPALPPIDTASPATMAASEPAPSVATNASATPKPPSTSVNAQSPAPAVPSAAVPAAPKFTKQQVAGRLKQLKILYEAGLLTDSFYLKKVKECEAVQ